MPRAFTEDAAGGDRRAPAAAGMKRMQRLAASVVACCLAAACASAPSGPERGPERRLLADTGGAIEAALIVVASPGRSGLRNQALVETIARSLGSHTKLWVLAPPEMVLDPNPQPGRMEFVAIPDDLRFSIWPQDPFVVLSGPADGSRLLAPRGYGREQDREMPRVVGAALNWPVVQSELFFAGGNLLSDEREAFVGVDLIRENARDLRIPQEEVVRRFVSALGLPVQVVGRLAQPVAHLDMILTPLGHGRIALADPRLGAELARGELAERPDQVLEFERRTEEEFFGSPAIRTLTDHEGRTVHRPSIVGGTARAIDDSRALGDGLERIAQDLRGRGYEVVRVPLLLTRSDETKPPPWLTGGPDYPTLSYNNVLIERVEGRDRVYLPRYGFPGLDRAAGEIWARAGFEVHGVPGVTTSAIYRGSLRCTIKVLQRSPAGR